MSRIIMQYTHRRTSTTVVVHCAMCTKPNSVYLSDDDESVTNGNKAKQVIEREKKSYEINRCGRRFCTSVLCRCFFFLFRFTLNVFTYISSMLGAVCVCVCVLYMTELCDTHRPLIQSDCEFCIMKNVTSRHCIIMFHAFCIHQKKVGSTISFSRIFFLCFVLAADSALLLLLLWLLLYCIELGVSAPVFFPIFFAFFFLL